MYIQTPILILTTKCPYSKLQTQEPTVSPNKNFAFKAQLISKDPMLISICIFVGQISKDWIELEEADEPLVNNNKDSYMGLSFAFLTYWQRL